MNPLFQSLEPWLLAYLLNSLWQIPLVFCAALAAARLARPAGPRFEHRIWVGAVILEATLPAIHFQIQALWQRAWSMIVLFRTSSAPGGETRVILGAGTPSGVPVPWLSASFLALMAAAYLCALLYFAGRLLRGLWVTESIRRSAITLDLPQAVSRNLHRFERLLGVDTNSVLIATSSAINGPATVGIRSPTVLLPADFLSRLSDAEIDAVFAHEIAHIRRGDFLKNLLLGILSLPAAYHPVLVLTRTRLAESREMVCDTMAAEAIGGREAYARSLLRLAALLSDRTAPRILHAIGIFDANIFERRVMNLTRRTPHIPAARRLAIAAACALLAVATCASALALRLDVNEPNAAVNEPKAQSPAPPNPSSINVKETSLNIVSKVQPIFPPEEKEKAKANKTKIDAKVLLGVLIGKDGAVKDINVTKSEGENFDKSAMDAVKQWRWKPYLLNGEPIEVKTTITVFYTLKR
jgi:TonB family protein